MTINEEKHDYQQDILLFNKVKRNESDFIHGCIIDINAANYMLMQYRRNHDPELKITNELANRFKIWWNDTVKKQYPGRR